MTRSQMDEGRTASATPAVLELRVQGRKRLVLLLATLMVMIVALAGLGIRQLQELTRRLTEIAEDYVPITVAVTEIDLLQHKQAIQLEQSLRLGEAVDRGEVLAPLDRTGRPMSEPEKPLELSIPIDRSRT